jgi:hypothetical protein
MPGDCCSLLDKFDNNYLCGFARRQDETRRIDTMMRLSELKTKAKSVRKNQELELSERSKITIFEKGLEATALFQQLKVDRCSRCVVEQLSTKDVTPCGLYNMWAWLVISAQA